METIQLDGLTVTVEADGETPAPWGQETVYRYKVRVESAEGTYECPAWGSIHDYQTGTSRDYEGIGAMVAGELLSAAYDPDEFWNMAVEGDRPTRERLNQINQLLDQAVAMLPSLERNADAIQRLEDGEEVETDA